MEDDAATSVPDPPDSTHLPPPPPPSPPLPVDRDARRQAQLSSHLSLVRSRLSGILQRRPSRASSLLIRAGDALVVYSSPQLMTPLLITAGSIFSNRFGHFHHDDFIGRPYASRIHARAPLPSPGYVIPLPITPELWTLSLTHRTQILYFADISLIVFHLNLLPGSVVLESGTGSGSLTVSIARCIAPTGHCHTFEFNRDRVQRARKDFGLLSLTRLISVHHRDVCRDGFPRVEGGVDAVFLDLPSPWEVVESCWGVLRHLGRLASFSPCIEQVQRVVAKLDEGGKWGEVRTMEVLLREYEVSEAKVERMGKGKVKAKAPDRRRKDAAKRKGEETTNAATATKRVKEEEGRGAEEMKAEEDGAEETKAEEEMKVEVTEEVKPAEEQKGDGQVATSPGADVWAQRGSLRAALQNAGSYAGGVVGEHEVRYPLVMKSPSVSRGHTGYLTFATALHFTSP